MINVLSNNLLCYEFDLTNSVMKTLKWGLIGAGDIACKRIAPALRNLPDCDFVGVSRARSDLVESFARQFSVRKWFADWRYMLSDPEIEAVYLATPIFAQRANNRGCKCRKACFM